MKLKKKAKRKFIDVIEITFIASTVLILTFVFLAQPLVITGNSMEPNFSEGDQLLTEKLTKSTKPFDYGEVVIIKHPENSSIYLIKRVVALPGDTFEIKDSKVYVNGIQAYEPYLVGTSFTTEGTIIKKNTGFVLGENEYIVLGDNRAVSSDSRNWGPTELDQIVGRAFLVYYPISSFRIVQ